MNAVRRLLPGGVALALAAPSAPAVPVRSDAPLAPVRYDIEARYDATSHSLKAVERVVYTNSSGVPLQDFPFHLYLEAFQPDSTLMREIARDVPSYRFKERDRGGLRIESLAATGAGDLTSTLHFVQPDEQTPVEPGDRTVVQARLPRPLPPGHEVEFHIAFEARFPETLLRTGYKRDFVMGAQWFPKLGVFRNGAWDSHQYHFATEFFSDFASYDVRLTLPRGFVAGATGELLETRANADGTLTLSYRAHDVHDFAWAAAPSFQAVEQTWRPGAGRPALRLRLLLPPQLAAQAPRLQSALTGALGLFERWYGPYPYPQLTVVVPPHGARATGMEYPSLVTVASSYWMPAGLRRPELELVHELAHQYFYAAVATDEVEEAWLDEGLASYSTVKAMEALYGPAAFLDLGGLTVGARDVLRLQFRAGPDLDPLARAGYRHLSAVSHNAAVYGRATCLLLTLEGLIGEERVRQGLRAYYERYRFRHPVSADLLAALQEQAGERDLAPFFAQSVLGSASLDYAVEEVDDLALAAPAGSPARYRTTVLLRRLGDFVLPVDYVVRFDDGHEQRGQWDGRERWRRLEFEGPARALSASVDPDGRVALDRDRFNNGCLRRPDGRARRKLQAYWIWATQFLAQAAAWLA